MKNNPYSLHRLALKPLLSPDPREEFKTIASRIKEIGEDRFLKFLASNMLTPLWHETLAKHETASLFSNDFTDKLQKASLVAAGRYLKQQHSLNQVTETLESASILHAVFKGVNTREHIYDNPAVRAADDIDILVSKADKKKALHILVKNGYELHLSAENISHEAVLSDANAKIDLHWDILRPGRTRVDLTDELLAAGKEYAGCRGFSNEAELFIMLVHPVFTKYATAPQASIIRLVDLSRWIESQKINWDMVYGWLEKGGVKTPAWVTAQWLETITGKTLPQSFIQKIEPSGLKKSYLRNWINKNYSTRFLKNPLLIKIGFTLPVHDTFSDAIRAVKILHREKKIAQAEIDKLQSSISS